MQIGNYELIWPGWFKASPAILLYIIMPGFLIFALYRYTKLSKLKKVAYTPLCIIGPVLISCLIPFLIALSGFYQVYNSEGSEAGTLDRYFSLLTMFGDYSKHVWVFLSGFVVYGIFNRIKIVDSKASCFSAIKQN